MKSLFIGIAFVLIIVFGTMLLSELVSLIVNGRGSYLAGQYRYFKYWYWTQVKRYHWQVMHDFGSGYATPKMNRKQALRYVASCGDRITGIDESLKVIFCRAKSDKN